jgi:protein-tyrosine-phosphatase
MKVLFVCRANVSRSQTAKALFDTLSEHDSESAGTTVGDKDGETVRDHLARVGISDFVFPIMAQQGLELRDNRRSQVTAAMVERADRIIVMTERDTLPDYLLNSEKVTHWKVRDTLRMPRETTREIADQIRRHVVELVREIG